MNMMTNRKDETMNKNQSRIQSVTTPLALVAALLASNTAMGDITQGGDVDFQNIGITGSGWVTVDDGTVYFPVGSWRLGLGAAASGTLTVKDPGTRVSRSITSIGDSGSGTVSVSGGAVLITSTPRLGEMAGSHGSMTVLGSGSEVNCTSLAVGLEGVGTLFVGSGGYLSLQQGGSVNNGSATISGGELISSGLFSVGGLDGELNQGVVRVENGGVINCVTMNVGDAVTITGNSSIVQCNSLNIGDVAEGGRLAQCFVRDGAAIQVNGNLLVRAFGFDDDEQFNNSELVIQDEGSIVSVGGNVVLMRFFAPVPDGDAARIFVNDGASMFVTEDFTIHSGCGLAGGDSVVSISGDLVLQPDFNHNDKPFIAYTPSHHEVPFISLNGDLVFDLRNGSYLSTPHNSDLTLAPGDRFPVIAIGGTIVANGTDTLARFDNREEGDIVDTYNGIDLYITYLGGDGNDIELYTLEAEPCLADLTKDGSLDFFDVSAFLTAFGNSDPIADFSGDGSFDFFDVSAFLSAFSAGCP